MHTGRDVNGQAVSLADRLRKAFLKPVAPGTDRADQEPRTLEELESQIKSANDKERLFGVFGGPLGAAIGLVIINALIANDPATTLSDGLPNKLHVSIALYHGLLIEMLALCLLMVVMSLLRKRLFLGLAMALYGLTVFNLHYWGFGVPFILCAAWLLVRAYRLQRELREVTGKGTSWSSSSGGSRPGRVRPNKRYTPPSL